MSQNPTKQVVPGTTNLAWRDLYVNSDFEMSRDLDLNPMTYKMK